MKKLPLYYFSAFISGMVVMAVELSATRLLAPYFGNSLYIWTNLIGLIMVALAAGYYCGGIFADGHPSDHAYFGLILLTGTWVVAIPFFSATVSNFLLHSFPNLAMAERFGSFFAVLFFFAFHMFVLGMMVPFTVKMIVQKVKDIGRISGKISMTSTLGSLVGTFFPVLVLVPYLGTTKTFVFVGLILVYLSAFGLRNWRVFLLATLGLALFWVVPPVYANSQIIAAEDSAYGYIFITENEEGVRSLHIDNPLGTQSLYDPASPIPDERYYYSYFGVLPAMQENTQKVLILGHAGGSFTRIFNAYYPQLQLTGVEIDPAVTRMAQEYMGLKGANVNVVHSDARTFLQNTSETYDLILLDTYHVSSIPSHLATEEFFRLASEHLNEDGILALNAAAPESELLTVLKNTLASVFADTGTLPIPGSFNTMLVGSADSHFSPGEVPADLEYQKETLLSDLTRVNYDANVEVFTDEKPLRIDLLTEEMSMDLLEGFTLR